MLPKGVKDDEAALWLLLCGGVRPRDGGRHLGMHPRRVNYLCLKWSGRGIYDYGTAPDLGWVRADYWAEG